MQTQPTLRRLGSKLVLAALLGVGTIGALSGSPADAWCNPGPGGSGLKEYGEETYRSGTCDGDGIYLGSVRDHPTVADGECAHVRIYSGGSWTTQAYACTSSWVGYQVYSAPKYPAKLCRGTTSICTTGGYSGA